MAPSGDAVTDLRDDRHIRGVVLNARDATDRIRLQDQLTEQAFHDALTGLANRALFRDRLDQALARSARSHEPLAVLLVDLDGFKQVNDSLGHDAGDHLLQQVAVRFAESTRPGDTLAGLGGDEFALLLEGAGEDEAGDVCARLLARVSDPASIAGVEVALGASIGIALHPGGHGASDELVRHADVAMYAAKEAGRGRWELSARRWRASSASSSASSTTCGWRSSAASSASTTSPSTTSRAARSSASRRCCAGPRRPAARSRRRTSSRSPRRRA